MPIDRPDWITFTVRCARHYGVRPAFALGVAHAESSLPGHANFRFTKKGRYYLPWGVHQYVVRERGWPVWDIYVQTEVAIRALARWISKGRRLHRGISNNGAEAYALKTYNKTCDRAYINRVREGQRKFGRLCD